MSLEKQYINTKCLRHACDSLGIKYSIIDEYGNFIIVNSKEDKKFFFINSSLSFNNSSIDKVCKDKDFSHKLLHDVIKMPKSFSFFNPRYHGKYKQYRKHKNISEILDYIEEKISYPTIIKMNSGHQGKNVYLCKTREKARYALKRIFNKRLRRSDYIALAQEYINIQKEFRAIFFKEKLILLYEKSFIKENIKNNISPLHQINSKAILINDKKLKSRIEKFGKQIFKKFPIEFVGMDIAVNDKDELFLIELNTNLGFEYFVRDNGEKPLVEMYKNILKQL